eukprot:gene11279-2051_t
MADRLRTQACLWQPHEAGGDRPAGDHQGAYPDDEPLAARWGRHQDGPGHGPHGERATAGPTHGNAPTTSGWDDESSSTDERLPAVDSLEGVTYFKSIHYLAPQQKFPEPGAARRICSSQNNMVRPARMPSRTAAQAGPGNQLACPVEPDADLHPGHADSRGPPPEVPRPDMVASRRWAVISLPSLADDACKAGWQGWLAQPGWTIIGVANQSQSEQVLPSHAILLNPLDVALMSGRFQSLRLMPARLEVLKTAGNACSPALTLLPQLPFPQQPLAVLCASWSRPGYLAAMHHGADVIFDGDCFHPPLPGLQVYDQHAPDVAEYDIDAPLVNTHLHTYLRPLMWPRGLPLDHVHAMPDDARCERFLRHGSPVHRLSIQHHLPSFAPGPGAPAPGYPPHHEVHAHAFSAYLPQGQWSVLDTHTTAFLPEAYWLLMPPPPWASGSPGADHAPIWRSLLAQPLLWLQGGRALFHQQGGTALEDEAERQLYRNTSRAVWTLARPGSNSPLDSPAGCALRALCLDLVDNLVGAGVLPPEAHSWYSAWLSDLQALGHLPGAVQAQARAHGAITTLMHEKKKRMFYYFSSHMSNNHRVNTCSSGSSSNHLLSWAKYFKMPASGGYPILVFYLHGTLSPLEMQSLRMCAPKYTLEFYPTNLNHYMPAGTKFGGTIQPLPPVGTCPNGAEYLRAAKLAQFLGYEMFKHPRVQQFEYLLRLDEDIHFDGHSTTDVFRDMAAGGILVGWNQGISDNIRSMESSLLPKSKAWAEARGKAGLFNVSSTWRRSFYSGKSWTERQWMKTNSTRVWNHHMVAGCVEMYHLDVSINQHYVEYLTERVKTIFMKLYVDIERFKYYGCQLDTNHKHGTIVPKMRWFLAANDRVCKEGKATFTDPIFLEPITVFKERIGVPHADIFHPQGRAMSRLRRLIHGREQEKLRLCPTVLANGTVLTHEPQHRLDKKKAKAEREARKKERRRRRIALAQNATLHDHGDQQEGGQDEGDYMSEGDEDNAAGNHEALERNSGDEGETRFAQDVETGDDVNNQR